MKYECPLLPIVHFSASLFESRCTVCIERLTLKDDVAVVVCDGRIAMVHRDCIPDTVLL